MKNLLHHVDCMDDTLCDSILGLIGSRMWLVWVLLPLVRGDILELISFLLEELIYFLLVFNDSFSDYLSMFYERALSGLT